MRLSRQIQITIYTWLALGYQALGKPAWVSDFTARQTGKAYETICEGQGPSRDLARSEALASCKGAAIRQLKTTVNFKSLSIETEHDARWRLS